MNVSRAAALVERHGLLLVYPITNRREPRSLWGDLWHLREFDATFERAPLFGKAFRKVLASLDAP